VAVLAPTGRDVAIIEGLLRESALAEAVLPIGDTVALAGCLERELSFAVATEDALSRGDLRGVSTWLQNQPPWSDMPFIILTQRGGGPERNPAAARLSEVLGNVTFLERPFHPTTFVSVARTALRGRSRQFEARARIEQLRQNEELLTQLNETLEQRVMERTAALKAAHEARLQEITQRLRAEEQLRQAQKMEAMGQITGGVAHDFNNLLLAVLANLDLLRDQVAGAPDAHALIEGAVQAAQRGASLTQRLLAFARRQNLRVEPTDIAGLVGGMMGLIERSLGARLELQMTLRPGLPLALVDANQLELALLNLVVNARDAMPEGGAVGIELSLRSAEAPGDAPGAFAAGDYVCLCVTDSGHGMDERTLQRAVEPFFSTKEPGKGTGLGLSMIDGLMTQLNGRLLLSSRIGEGTRAELWLPVAAAAPAPAPVAAAPAPVPTPTPGAASLAVLLVEDDPLIAMATAAMLKKLGHQTREARNGAQALTLIESGTPFDLMITDYSMPKMTGMQLAEAVRKLRPDLPIVLATGYAELPADATLELPRLDKPYMIRDLARAIEAVRPA
jgi:signal transduction histidine kinase/CheY-like chemotaxis protein